MAMVAQDISQVGVQLKKPFVLYVRAIMHCEMKQSRCEDCFLDYDIVKRIKTKDIMDNTNDL